LLRLYGYVAAALQLPGVLQVVVVLIGFNAKIEVFRHFNRLDWPKQLTGMLWAIAFYRLFAVLHRRAVAAPRTKKCVHCSLLSLLIPAYRRKKARVVQAGLGAGFVAPFIRATHS
jgi:hypothetical protein